MILDAVFGPIARAAAALPGAHRFEGARPVARRELIANIKSVRMIVVSALLMLAVVGGAAGISALSGGGVGGGTGTVTFLHAAWPDGPNGSGAVAVWASDPFGSPQPGVRLSLVSTAGVGGSPKEAVTAADGYAWFANLPTGTYYVIPASGPGFGEPPQVYVAPSAAQYSVDMVARDIGGNGSAGDILVHVVDQSGAALSGIQVMEGTQVAATTDERGYAHMVRGPGDFTFTISHSGENVEFREHVSEPSPSIFSGGANPVMYIVSTAFIPLILPIMAIAVAHDAIARERAQGSLESLLSRPVTRWGVVLGKFVGSTGALLIPVYTAITVGALVIGAMTGKGIDGGFFGGILFGATVYTAAYVLLLLILSTLARTTGTAIMFGVLLWLVYFLLWNVVVLMLQLAAGLTPSDRAYYELAIYSGLFNLNSLYGAIVAVSFPSGSNPYVFNGQELLPAWGPFVAYAVWLVALFIVALWVFDRRASD